MFKVGLVGQLNQLNYQFIINIIKKLLIITSIKSNWKWLTASFN